MPKDMEWSKEVLDLRLCLPDSRSISQCMLTLSLILSIAHMYPNVLWHIEWSEESYFTTETPEHE